MRVTEKHYNPWVRSRQEEADVRNAMEERSANNRGYKAGTDCKRPGQLKENKEEIMAERVGFEALNVEPCNGLHGLARTRETKHLS